MAPVDDALDRLERCIDWREGRGRERAAEALATVRSALEQLREERDSQDWYSEWYAPMKRRAEAAEAEVQQLREGLRKIESILKRKRDREGTGPYRALTVACETLEGDPERHVRALLADGPTDGGERHAEGLDERGIYGGRAYPDGGGAK